MPERTFNFGPWRGSLRATEPFINAPEIARLMVNGYLPDSTLGSGFYSRPGTVQDNDARMATTGTNAGQGVFSFISPTNGVAYNFLFADGKVWRWQTLGGAPVDVTPANVNIADTGFVYAEALGGTVIVNDGQNPPWQMSDLGSTPVTATPVDYETATVLLSRGTTDTSIANAQTFVVIDGTFANVTAQETALPAGTIPTNQWGVYRVSSDISGTITVTAGAANYGAGYASEAAAIAAVPATPVDEWNLGYFTVQTNTGNPFVANTDALQGGASGNPANATNYYRGTGVPWLAFGSPVVYTGAIFFVLDTVLVNGTATNARTTIAWSEPNQPLVGYFQGDYDNTWTLTQTSTEPIYALCGTNDALYYFRQLSVGAISGAPGVNFASTATHDVVSGNVGCVLPNTVETFLNFVYFCDQFGRPWRFAVGGSPEPIWQQARELFEDSAQAVNDIVRRGVGWATIEPNLNVYIVGTYSQTFVTDVLPDEFLVFDARSGAYFGLWTIGVFEGAQTIAGVVRNADQQPVLVFLEGPDANYSGVIATNRLTLVAENIWQEQNPAGNSPFGFTLQTHYTAFDPRTVQNVNRVYALAETGNAATPIAGSGFAYTQGGRTTLPSYTPVTLATNVDGIGVYKWLLEGDTRGRGTKVQLTFAPTTNQVKLYSIGVDTVESMAGIEDR